MANPTIKKEIDSYLNKLTPEQQQSVLGLIKSFLEPNERISQEQYNQELNAAEQRVADGNFISQEDLEAHLASVCD